MDAKFRINNMGYSLDHKEMGRRLAIARKIAGRRPEEAANVIGVPTERISSAEDGSTPLEIREIDSLALFYNTSISRFLAHDAIHSDLVPRFKKHSQTEDKHVFKAVKLLNSLFPVEVELEKLFGIVHSANFPRSFDIRNGNVKELAVEHAQFLRKFLGIGNDPIPDIFSVIEEKLGIRLYQRNLEVGSKIMGLFAFDEELGACILLNANYPRPTRVISAAHELGHFMTDRNKVDVLEENNQKSSRDERYAMNFSYVFTMPEESFSDSYKKISKGSDVLTKEIVIELANKFHVPISACIRQLAEYGLVKNAKNWLNAVGSLNSSEKRKQLGDKQYNKRYDKVDDVDQIVPNRIGLLIHRAWKNELLSEGQMSSMLRLGRLEVRKILYDIEIRSTV